MSLTRSIRRLVWPLLATLSNTHYKFDIGDKVIFVNTFGVVYLWTISEKTTYQPRRDGPYVRAYHHEGTDTPWFPTQETELRFATKADLKASPQELQQRYGFTPTEWYGCW